MTNICSLGYVLHLINTHFYKERANFGYGTNIVSKFKELLYLLKAAIEKGVHVLHVYGDSSLNFKWMQD